MSDIVVTMDQNWFIKQESRLGLGYKGDCPNIFKIQCAFELDDELNYFLDIADDTLPMEMSSKQGVYTLKTNLAPVLINQDGSVALQLRASNKNTCKKSNIIYGYISDSLESELRYKEAPALPTEFAEYEYKIRNLIKEQEAGVVARVDELVEEKLPSLVEHHLADIVEPIIEDKVPPMIEAYKEDVQEMIDEAISKLEFESKDPRSTLKKTEPDYLYSIQYDNKINWNLVNKFNREHYPTPGGCSGVRFGNFVGRSFDFYYSHGTELAIHYMGNGDQYEFIGVAGGMPEFNKDIVSHKTDSPYWQALPGMLLDGINSYGLYGQLNVINGEDDEPTKGTNPEASEEISILMLVSYVLAHCKSVDEIVDCLADVNIWSPVLPTGDVFDYHAMFADKNKTVLVEPYHNHIYVRDITDMPYMTNLRGLNLIWDDCKYPDKGGIQLNSIDPHASGVERYELLKHTVDAYPDGTVASFEQMKDLIKKVKYSNLYEILTEPRWYSEYNHGSLTVFSPPEDYTEIFQKGVAAWADRSRDDVVVWHSQHISVYDIENRKVQIYTQEKYSDPHEMAIDFPIDL